MTVRKRGIWNIFIVVMIFLFSPSLFINGFYAKEIEYPRSCYNDKEIAALRAWEKEWAGKKIDSSNASAVREYLPESFYFLLTDTNTWGRHWFVIVPYREIVPTPGTIELTKKHHSSSKLDTESGELITYVAGVPFPNTTDPLEMAHNFRCRNFGDSYRSSEFGYIVDGQFRYDMRLEINNNLCFFSGRTDKQPVPEFPKNPKGLWRAFTMLQKQPPEVRNMRILELHYKDRLKAYDSWIWNPTIRRVRRRSTTERQDAQGGSDFCGFDNFGWDGPISLNTYRYIAAKELLMSRHNGCKKLDHTSGDCFWNGTQRERIRVHIIEATSKEANFLYSKMIWYIDPETWQILYSERYGRDGKLWKVLDQIGFVTAGYNNIEINSFCASHMVDVQRIHATLGFVEYEFGVDFPDGMFTTEYLQKHGY